MLKRKKLGIILAAVICVFVLLSLFLHSRYVVPILMYHAVYPEADPEYRLAVTAQTFERQMGFLKKWHYNVVSLEELSRMIAGKKNIPAKTVAITFDDGCKDNLTYAFPVLKKYSFPATVFVIIDEVGRPRGDHLNWEEIKALKESGIVDIGSHALGPEPLVNLKSDEELKRQIFESKKIMEEKLGQKVVSFSYPEGRFNDKIRQYVIAAGYKVAVTTNPGKNYPNDDIFALKRLRISSNAANMFIFWVESSGFYNFMRESKRK